MTYGATFSVCGSNLLSGFIADQANSPVGILCAATEWILWLVGRRRASQFLKVKPMQNQWRPVGISVVGFNESLTWKVVIRRGENERRSFDVSKDQFHEIRAVLRSLADDEWIDGAMPNWLETLFKKELAK